jgi:hypothetical protein
MNTNNNSEVLRGLVNELLDKLMKEAEERAYSQLKRSGTCQPFLHIFGVRDGCGTLSQTDPLSTKAQMDDFTKFARMVCIDEDAHAAVFVSEAWLMKNASQPITIGKAPSEAPRREEAIVLMGETREKSIQQILPIVRHPDGSFKEFGTPYCNRSAWTKGQSPTFISAKVPTEHEREAADNYLSRLAREGFREREKLHKRGMGRSM